LKIQDNLLTFFELVRVRNALIAFLGVFIGALLSPYPACALAILAAGLSAALILAGGNAINDYFDVNIDRVNKPKRPIPSGRISSTAAVAIALILFLAGIILATAINKYCLAIAILNTIILILYAKYSKRILLIANLTVSYLVASIFIYGTAVTITTQGADAAQLLLTIILAACAFLMTLSREIIKDIEDIEGDKTEGASTLPIVFGAKKAKMIAITAGAIAIAISSIPAIVKTGAFNSHVYTLVIALADIRFLTAFTMPPNKSQKTIVVGMILSLLAFMLAKIA